MSQRFNQGSVTSSTETKWRYGVSAQYCYIYLTFLLPYSARYLLHVTLVSNLLTNGPTPDLTDFIIFMNDLRDVFELLLSLKSH